MVGRGSCDSVEMKLGEEGRENAGEDLNDSGMLVAGNVSYRIWSITAIDSGWEKNLVESLLFAASGVSENSDVVILFNISRIYSAMRD